MLMSWPTLMNRPRSRRIAASIRRAFRRCFSWVSRSIASGRRNRRAIASVYAAGRVLGHVEDGDFVELDAELPGRVLERFSTYGQARPT